MALSLRIHPEIWRLTLLSGLTLPLVAAVPLVGCASKADSGVSQQTNGTSAAGSSGSQVSNTAGPDRDAGSTTATGQSGTPGQGGAGGGSTGSTTGTGGGVSMGGAESITCDEAVGIPEAMRCDGIVPMPNSMLQGHLMCPNGLVHRVEAAACPSELPRADDVIASPTDAGSSLTPCTKDADCVEHDHGYCVLQIGFEVAGGTYCMYGCVTDSECGPGMICDCRSPVGQCVQADCAIDADCPCDSKCMRAEWDDGCGANVRYKCQGPEDSCVAAQDCLANDPASPDGRCAIYDEPLRAECSQSFCAIGRPFIVNGDDRIATLASRGDWLATGLLPDLGALTSTDCATLAQYWQAVGLMEHASIAAFARFALELLGQGAPPELLEATQRAMADETLHAKLAFALASRYAQRNLGPGPLDLTGAAPASSLAAMVHTAILEGAVGETIASMEAAEALQRASDPAVRSVLAQVVEDEANHARLAWSFLRWAVERDPSLRALIENTFAQACEPSEFDPLLADAPSAVTAHGLLSAALRQEVRARAIAEVILPCAQSLLLQTPLQHAA